MNVLPNMDSLLNKTLFTCQTTTQFASILGNVCYIMRKFILMGFPEKFIKHVYLDTTQNSNIFDNIKDELKKEKPWLIIRPKYSLSPDTMYSDTLPEWVESATYLFQDLQGYDPVFLDKKNDIYIYAIPDRIRFTLNLEFVCESLMEQWNLGTYLKGSVKHKRPFYLRDQLIESVLPKKFVQLLASLNNYDLSRTDSVAQFRKYIDANSRKTITEKVSASSGRSNYYYQLQTDLLCNYEDYPDMDDGEEKGQVKNDFKITDMISVEFWGPMNYIMVAESRMWADVNNALKEQNEKQVSAEGEGIYFSSTYTHDPAPDKLVNGKERIIKSVYVIESEEDFVNDTDVVEFYDIFPIRYKAVLGYIRKHNLNYSNYFEIHVYGSLENQRIDLFQIKVDWKTYKLYNKYPRVGGNYAVIIYADIEKCNKLLRKLNDTMGAYPYQENIVNKVADDIEVKDTENGIAGNKDLDLLTKEEHDIIIDSSYYNKN